MYPKNDTILYHHIHSARSGVFSFICSVDKFNSTKIVCAPAPDKNPMLSNFQILRIPDAMLPICTYMYSIRLYGTQRRSKGYHTSYSAQSITYLKIIFCRWCCETRNGRTDIFIFIQFK